jgi:Holliday junction resolvase RusA-like endonuclease
MQKFIIKGRLDGLNEVILANRTNKYKGAKIKKDNETIVIYYARLYKLKPITKYPIKLKIDWYEKNKRRDIDNVLSAKKFILDGLVKAKILKGDGQKYFDEVVKENVYIDKENPHIEVTIIEND